MTLCFLAAKEVLSDDEMRQKFNFALAKTNVDLTEMHILISRARAVAVLQLLQNLIV